jgi:hypothetical protein
MENFIRDEIQLNSSGKKNEMLRIASVYNSHVYEK